MEARVKLKKETAHQESLSHKLLRWMQNHPNLTKNTNCAKMARCNIGAGTYSSRRQTFARMVNERMIYKTGNTKSATFRINYMHLDIPPDILENAPSEEQKRVKKTIAGMKDGQYLDSEGCVVTPGTKKPKKYIDFKPSKKGIKKNTTGTKIPVTTPEEKPTYNTPPQVSVDKNGQSISITINLNIN